MPFLRRLILRGQRRWFSMVPSRGCYGRRTTRLAGLKRKLRRLEPGRKKTAVRRHVSSGGRREKRRTKLSSSGGQYLRLSASPAATVTAMKLASEIDVRPVLPAIRVPTLVLHRTGDRVIPISHGRYFAQQIPGAIRELD